MSGRKSLQIANYVPPERVVVRRSTDYLAIEDRDVAAAVQFIRQRGCQHMHVSEILDTIGISRSMLESRFKKIMGKAIHEEILGVMMAPGTATDC